MPTSWAARCSSRSGRRLGRTGPRGPDRFHLELVTGGIILEVAAGPARIAVGPGSPRTGIGLLIRGGRSALRLLRRFRGRMRVPVGERSGGQVGRNEVADPGGPGPIGGARPVRPGGWRVPDWAGLAGFLGGANAHGDDHGCGDLREAGHGCTFRQGDDRRGAGRLRPHQAFGHFRGRHRSPAGLLAGGGEADSFGETGTLTRPTGTLSRRERVRNRPGITRLLADLHLVSDRR